MTKPTREARKVLFLSADQWRGECLSALGHKLVKTPHLDRLAGAGRAVPPPLCPMLALRPGPRQPADRASI